MVGTLPLSVDNLASGLAGAAFIAFLSEFNKCFIYCCAICYFQFVNELSCQNLSAAIFQHDCERISVIQNFSSRQL